MDTGDVSEFLAADPAADTSADRAGGVNAEGDSPITEGDISKSIEADAPDETTEEEHGEVVESVGDPERLSEHWQYQGPTNDCAIYAEGTSMEAMGKDFDIDKEREAGQAEGGYHPEEGTTRECVGKVWERNGVEADRYVQMPTGDEVADSRCAFRRMTEALDERRAVVALVDPGEMQYPEHGGHALWVTGFEERESGQQFVVTNDSGVPDGRAKRYAAEDFDKGWRRYNYEMLASKEPFPGKDSTE
jgi:hypothetical protein